jgi:hypothetical protein
MDQCTPAGLAGQGKAYRRALSLHRTLFLLLGLLTAGLALADEPNTSLTGVWAGSLGAHTVMVCITHRGPEPGFGLFYFRDKPGIDLLTPNAGSSAGNGAVASSWSDHNGSWSLDPVDSEQITGQWTGPGDSPAMISLTRMPAGTERDRSSPCASRAFNEPTETPPLVTAGPTLSTGGLNYRIITLNAGRADEAASARGLHIDTLEIVSEDPAAKRLNAVLRQRLPVSDADLLNRLYSCRRRERDADGQEGIASERIVAVKFIKERWLSVQTDDNSNCAAPRTAHWVNHYTWDLQSGRVVDLVRWFKNAPAVNNPEGQAPGEYAEQLPPALRALVVAGLTPAQLAACPALGSPDAGYIPHLEDDGMRFSFPGSGQPPCTNEALVPYGDIQALLSEDGRTQLRPLLAGHPPTHAQLKAAH